MRLDYCTGVVAEIEPARRRVLIRAQKRVRVIEIDPREIVTIEVARVAHLRIMPIHLWIHNHFRHLVADDHCVHVGLVLQREVLREHTRHDVRDVRETMVAGVCPPANDRLISPPLYATAWSICFHSLPSLDQVPPSSLQESSSCARLAREMPEPSRPRHRSDQ